MIGVLMAGMGGKNLESLVVEVGNGGDLARRGRCAHCLLLLLLLLLRGESGLGRGEI